MNDVLANIEMGVGTSSWGDSLRWGFGQGYTLQDLQETYHALCQHENILLDTAEIYGLGQSEQFVGSFKTRVAQAPLIATKCFPAPWRITNHALLHALRGSLQRLRTNQVTLYQMHHQLPPLSIGQWMRALVTAAEEGLTRFIGVSNYNSQQTLHAHQVLENEGLQLASNQVHYSLLNRHIEYNGLLQLCQDLGIRVIAYSPLEKGLLSGKYTPSNPPPGWRGWRYRRAVQKIAPLISTMRELGRAYAENEIVKTPAQVALNWCLCKGTLPIPGAKNQRQFKANIGATGWRLAPEDVDILDRLSDDYHIQIKQG